MTRLVGERGEAASSFFILFWPFCSPLDPRPEDDELPDYQKGGVCMGENARVWARVEGEGVQADSAEPPAPALRVHSCQT